MASSAIGPPKTLPAEFDKWDAGAGKAPATLPADFAEWDKPSAGQRYMQSTGLTSGGRSLPQQVGYEASQAYHHPIETAKETVTAPVTGYAQAATDQYQRMKDHWNSGDHAGAVVHGLYYLLTPIGGAQMGKAADQSASGDMAGAAGSMTPLAVGMAAGSPTVRSAASTAANATRNAAASTLKAGAKPVASIATGITAGHELLSGRPLTAAFALDKGKPFITKGMNAAAELIRPGQAPIEMLPLTRQVLSSQAMRDFLHSSEMESKVAQTEAQKPMLALPPGQYEMPAGSPAGSQIHASPASSNPLFTADPIFLQRQAAKTAGRPKLEMPVINPDRQPQPSSLTGGANAFETANPELLKSANARLKSWRDWHFVQNLKNEMNKQEGQGIQQADAFIQDHNQQAAGGKSTAYKAAARNSLGDSATDSQVTAMAQKLQQQDQDMAGLLQKSLEQAQTKKQSGAAAQAQAMFDKAKAAQGGHAGGGVSSIEELNRPGVNYVVSKGGQITYHGKSFAPESTPAGAAHVTVLPGGKIRVNAGSLSDAQSAAIKRAVNEK